MSVQPVSAVLITHNEERVIERCLRSLLWADEIVVVDACSSDRTEKLCRDPHAPWHSKLKFLTRAWTGFKDQRNFALHMASHDWVLVVDADEEVSEELKNKILEMMKNTAALPHRYWKVRRQEFFLRKPIQYGVWNPSYQDRFFYRPGIEYINDIHEYPRYPEAPGRIHEPLIHDPDFGIERFLEKMNKYTSIEARDRYKAGARTNLFHMFCAFFVMFYKTFFYYRGFKDGAYGFVIGCLEGVSRVVRHVKIWRLMKEDASS